MLVVAAFTLHYYQELKTMSVCNINMIYNEIHWLAVLKYVQVNWGHTEEDSVTPKGKGKFWEHDRKENSKGSHMSQSFVVRESKSGLWGTATWTCEIAWWTQGRTRLSMIFTHLFIPQAFVVYHGCLVFD